MAERERDRLKQIHQTDLMESRINEEFVEWLKTQGPTYLLIVMVFVAAVLGWNRWKQHKVTQYSQAWTEFADCRLPGAFEDVAQRYPKVPGLAPRAWLHAADALVAAVQTGTPLGTDPSAQEKPPPLTEMQRTDYLTRARGLYQKVIETDNDSLSMALHVVSALQGLGVVAESLGEAGDARTWYDAAADRAAPYYPWLAAEARQRAATVDESIAAVTLPTQAELPKRPPREAMTPVTIDPALSDLVLPPDEPEA
jgi:hypothetical protein